MSDLPLQVTQTIAVLGQKLLVERVAAGYIATA